MTPNLINHFKALSNRALGKLFYVICNKPTNIAYTDEKQWSENKSL